MPPKPEAIHLVRLAERDRDAFRVLIAASSVARESAFFHAQQAVEKYLNAVLVTYAVVFRRTHDLLQLANLAGTVPIELPVARDALEKLNPYAVLLRYEDVPIVPPSPEEAHDIVESVRVWAMRQVGM